MPLRLGKLIVAAAGLVFAPLSAQAGDPAAGEREFRQCRSCHMIVSPSGETIQRGGRVGPNLWGIIGQPAAANAEFSYSQALTAARERGLIWTEETFVAYVQNPTQFLREFLGDSSVRSSMNYQARNGAEDLFAYLQSLQE